MLIDFKETIKKYNIDIKGIIQIGAHWAEEHNTYLELGVRNIVYIEPCQEAYDKMVVKFDAKPEFIITDKYKMSVTNTGVSIYKVACGDTNGEMEMFVSHNNQGQSNSLLKPLLHLNQHPEVVFNDKEIVEVRKLDNIEILEKENYNILVLDCQGFEGNILKGATETLKNIELIYTECNNGQTYENNMEIGEMDEFLKPFGFVRMETYWPSPSWTWGDCVFVKDVK